MKQENIMQKKTFSRMLAALLAVLLRRKFGKQA